MSDLRICFPKPCSQKWEEMAPDGCNRYCSRCTTTIHDLANYTPDEGEALLASPEPVCVRVKLNGDPEVATRPGGSGKIRRIVISAAASAGLLAMSSAAIAAKDGPEGIIAGVVHGSYARIKVVAIGADGLRHEVTTDRKGRYRIKHLPPGTYDLEFSYDEFLWTAKSVIVKDEKITYLNTFDPDAPIIVGVMTRDLDAYF